MGTQRVDLLAGIPVNLTALLTQGAFYEAQHRGQTGALYVAELVATATPTAHDVASNGFAYGVGDMFRLRPDTFANYWAMAPNGGRLTIGNS